MSSFRTSLRLRRQENIQHSVGVICEECNQTSYYFNTRNINFGAPKRCLICSEEKLRGIILEDFLFTLRGKIRNHYELNKIDTSASISLKQVLKRFTYDNEQVLEKLADLLCQEDDSFFQIKGRYQSTVDDLFIENCIKEAIEKWNNFAKELKHHRRFTHTDASRFYENLIGSCMHRVDKKSEFNSALKTINKGTVFYRGRLVKDDRNAFLSNPEKVLSAPPDYLAANSRMSPPGISFMYTAGDPETAISELRPYVNDTIAIGEFVSTKDLNFFDFTLLDDIQHESANILDNPRKDKYLQNRYILGSLHGLISTPFRATDTSYIETQMFAETIRNYRNGLFDGIIFKSSQRDGGVNYVVFGDYLNNETSGATIKDYHMEFNCNVGAKFYQVVKMVASTKTVC
ncbi:RES family NAD+ phosphorylase [Yersinia proxima]|uniref:RES family NAD+ phosphorylase n=1 Tax=Yersinia proxima TaxID=2890316 RepID=UPI00158B9ED2|nr:RES family NAD+ phosphorylase [Yersinia proxima]